MPSLGRALFDYELDLLHVISVLWDVDLEVSEQAQAVDQLTESLLQPGAVSATWERLAEPQQEALQDLIANGGRMPYSHFMRLYGELRPMGPARREREKPWLNPANVTEALYYRALIVRVFEQTPGGAQEFIAIPADLMALMPKPAPDELTRTPGYPVAPLRKIEGGHITAPDDMATLISYLLLRKSNAHEWLVNEPVAAIDPYLRRPDQPAYRALLVQLAYDLGMIYDDTILTHVSTHVNREAARNWLEAPRMHQARSLAEAWLESKAWNDLTYTPGLEADQWPNTGLLARTAVLEMLKLVPAEIWWSQSGFIEYVQKYNPDFQRPTGDYSAWYLRDAYTGEIMHGLQYWPHIEGALLRFLFDGPMKWLGVVHAGQGAFLLTPLGLGLLEQADWPSEPDHEAFIRIDTQGVIQVPVDVSRYDRMQMARFSAWLSAPLPATYTLTGESRDEGAYVYRLTPQAIERVAEEGISISTHIIPFLQRLSVHSLPPNVLKMLEGWEAAPREVVVYDVVVVTGKDLGVYERLKDNKRIARWLGQQIGPHSHIVRREDMPALLNALREMGFLPLFDGHEKDDAP